MHQYLEIDINIQKYRYQYLDVGINIKTERLYRYQYLEREKGQAKNRL